MDEIEVVRNRRLSGVDAAFLYLERKELPLHIAAVATFESPLPFDEFIATIDSRLHLIPRYRQLAVTPPFHLGPPTWEPDPHFDIRRHILRTRLEPPGDDKQLEALAGRVLSERLDRNKPLWEILLVEGLKDGRGALILRVHHALADGVSGTSLIKVLFDESAAAGAGNARRKRYRLPQPAPALAPALSLADAVGNAIQSALDNLTAAKGLVVSLARSLSSGLPDAGLAELKSALPDLAAPIERLPFNKPCSGDRTFSWAEMDLNRALAVRTNLGGTLNDVILTVVSRALAHYVKAHKQTVTKRMVRIICPVSMRGLGEGETLGNRITFLPVSLPMDVRDPAQNLREVSARMNAMKRSHASDIVALAGFGIGAAPPSVQALFWSAISQITLPFPLFNTICTNIPGSPIPLYSAGRRMLALYPHVPTGYDLGVNIAATTYDARLFFGLTADAHAAPDADRLRDFLYVAFEELCRAAGVKKPRAAKPKAARPVTDKPVADKPVAPKAAAAKPRKRAVRLSIVPTNPAVETEPQGAAEPAPELVPEPEPAMA